jgi:hypothetical protein
MFRNSGWAALLTAMTFGLFATDAAAAGARPTYACFSAQNARVIGRLGANDASVRLGFEAGACLALEPGAPLADVERSGDLWRFRAFGAKPYLYADAWAAGFQPATAQAPQGFERYLPVTAKLLAAGRLYVQCRREAEQLAQRIADHDRRWRRYWGTPGPELTRPDNIIYGSAEGPNLVAEGEDLRRKVKSHDRRCRDAGVEADDDFVAFVATAGFAENPPVFARP